MSPAARPACGGDPFATPAFRADRYRAYRALRAESPVYEIRREGRRGREFVLTRHADVEAVLRDDRFSANRLAAEVFRERASELPEDLRPEEQKPSLLTVDPPHHTRLRKLVSRAFTPRRVEELAVPIRQRADRALDRWQRGEPVDLLATFAAPVPAQVIADLLGVPERDHERFHAWSDRMLRTLVGGRQGDLDGFAAARDALEGYLRERIRRHREEPREDLIGALVEAQDEGDALDDDELVATCTLLLVAGHETTMNLIGNGVWLLLSAATGAECFAADPERAVEEIARFESPLQGIARVATCDVELGGERLPAGSLVSAMIGAANRDPEVFAEPEVFDPSRAENPHLAFGHGVHFCLGAALARLESRIALAALFERFPGVELVEERPRWRGGPLLRGLEALPIRPER